jgi:hypothetical protein
VDEVETGPAINETVAKVVNKSLWPNKIDKEKIQAIPQKYKQPANMEERLQVPKIDKFLWNQLETNVKSTDISKQHIIDDFNKAATLLVAAMDHWIMLMQMISQRFHSSKNALVTPSKVSAAQLPKTTRGEIQLGRKTTIHLRVSALATLTPRQQDPLGTSSKSKARKLILANRSR